MGLTTSSQSAELDLMGARHRVGKLLLRRGWTWDGPGVWEIATQPDRPDPTDQPVRGEGGGRRRVTRDPR